MKTTNAYTTANTLLAESWVGLQIFTITCHLSRPPVDGRRLPSVAASDGTDRLHPVLGLHRTGRDRPRPSRPDCRPDGTIRSTVLDDSRSSQARGKPERPIEFSIDVSAMNTPEWRRLKTKVLTLGRVECLRSLNVRFRGCRSYAFLDECENIIQGYK